MQQTSYQPQTRETGTTTIGIICRDALILASESKSTMGWLVSSKEAQKIYKVDDKMALTTAGGAGDTQAVVRILQAEIALYKNLRNSQEFTVNAAATLLQNILQSTRYYPLMAMLILGGHDRNGFHLYSIDPVGGAEEDKYVSTGSGSPMAYGVLEAEFKEGLTKEEGVRMAARAIRSATQRDVFSGGRIVVSVITKDGFELVPDEKIQELLKK